MQQAELARLPATMASRIMPNDSCICVILKSLFEDDFGLFVALYFDNETHAVAIALIADVGDPFDFLVVDQLGDVLDQALFVYLVGQFGNNDILAILAALLDGRLGAHLKRASARFVRLLDSITPVNVARRRKIRSGTIFITCFRVASGFSTSRIAASTISRRLCGGILVAMPTAMPELPLISKLGTRVGRTTGSARFVVVGHEVDRFLVDVFQQHRRDARKTRLGIPHRRGRIAVHGAEVPLPVDQRIAHVENVCAMRTRAS